jgi:hypothetical protein
LVSRPLDLAGDVHLNGRPPGVLLSIMTWILGILVKLRVVAHLDIRGSLAGHSAAGFTSAAAGCVDVFELGAALLVRDDRAG